MCVYIYIHDTWCLPGLRFYTVKKSGFSGKWDVKPKTRRVWFPHERTGNHSCEKLQQIADAEKGMIRNQDMNSSNHLFVCSSFSRVHAYLSTQKDLKTPLLERWKWSVFPGQKNSSNKHFPSPAPSVRQSVRYETRAPQQVGNHKTSTTSIKAQRSTRLEKISQFLRTVKWLYVSDVSVVFFSSPKQKREKFL